MEISARIRIFLKDQKISKKEFLKTIGKSPSYLDNTKNISGDVLATILLKYENLSADWLLIGRGEMLRAGSSTQQAIGVGGDVHQYSAVYTGGSGNGGGVCGACAACAAKDSKIQALQAELLEFYRGNHRQ